MYFIIRHNNFNCVVMADCCKRKENKYRDYVINLQAVFTLRSMGVHPSFFFSRCNSGQNDHNNQVGFRSTPKVSQWSAHRGYRVVDNVHYSSLLHTDLLAL